MTDGWQALASSWARVESQPLSPPSRWFKRHVVEADVIQPYRHVWNVTLARWIDDLAALVFERQRTLAEGRSWFILRQEMRFLAETMQGDVVLAAVTVPVIERSTAQLEVRMLREAGETPLVESASTWILVNLTDRRPRRIDDELRSRLRL